MFLTAATRRCTTRISVSSLGIMLSHPLPVIALVGHYPANKLIGPRLLSKRLLRTFNQCPALEAPNHKHQITNDVQILNSNNQNGVYFFLVLNFEHLDFEFVCDLEFVIWNSQCEALVLSGISPAFAGLSPSSRQIPRCY